MWEVDEQHSHADIPTRPKMHGKLHQAEKANESNEGLMQ